MVHNSDWVYPLVAYVYFSQEGLSRLLFPRRFIKALKKIYATHNKDWYTQQMLCQAAGPRFDSEEKYFRVALQHSTALVQH